eukprot:468375_1
MINNAMVILLSIGQYDEEPTQPAKELIDAQLTDLAVEKDITNLVELFGPQNLNYTIYPTYNDPKHPQLYWKQSDIINLLQEKAEELSESKEEYDGLIVVISSHGIQVHICTSDFRLISKLAIHRIFSKNYKHTREIPRVFIFDGCEGSDEHGGRFGNPSIVSVPEVGKQKSDIKYEELVDDNTHNDTDEQLNSDALPSNFQDDDIEVKTKNVWGYDTKPPDYKLAVINAASPGFQSKLNSSFGSYLLYQFSKRVLIDLNQNNGKCKKFIGEICDEIQKYLADTGKQHITATFNEETRFIRFVKNEKRNVANVSNILMTELHNK